MADTTHPFLLRSGGRGMTTARAWVAAIPKATLAGALLPLVLVLVLAWNTLGAVNEARAEAARVATDDAISNETARLDEFMRILSASGGSASGENPVPETFVSVLDEAERQITARFETLTDLGAPTAQTERARSSTTEALNEAMSILESGDFSEASLAEMQRRMERAEAAIEELQSEATQRSAADRGALAATHDSIAARAILLTMAALWATLLALAVFNRRNRREVAALYGTVEQVAEGKMGGGLDTGLGPIHTTLTVAFGHAAVSIRDQLARMHAWAERSTIELELGEHFEGVTTRTDLASAVGNSFTTINPNLSSELMVTGPDGRRMLRVASSPEAGAPRCPVTDALDCPAMRSTSTQVMPDASAPGACIHLRTRTLTGGAACVPLLGPTGALGVIHATTERIEEIDDTSLEHLATLAELSASRLTAVTSMEQTMHRATTDHLTGLANRRMFEERARGLIDAGEDFILVMADLDHFKALNDTYGHDTGDQVLRVFARVLSENVRRTDLAARYGGEEFLVLLPHTSVTEALVTLDRVRVAMATTLGIHSLPVTTASFGVARSTMAPDLESMLRVTDAGLYRAKAEGRDRIVEADASMVQTMFGERLG
ncbi:MAG: GGDEF domain-containing protein [Microthrixaceae bacterium]